MSDVNLLSTDVVGNHVVGNPSSRSTELSAHVGISANLDRAIASHANASPVLLARLARSLDRQTLRNVVLNPQTPTVILIKLAPKFPGEFFQNPVFDLLLMENPSLLFDLPVVVLNNIIKRLDCPESILCWAARHGSKSHQLALVGRSVDCAELLKQVANGPHVKPAEAAAAKLLTC